MIAFGDLLFAFAQKVSKNARQKYRSCASRLRFATDFWLACAYFSQVYL